MAATGSFETSAVYVASSEYRNLTFSWRQVSQSVSDNSTTISWTLKGSGSYSGWVQVYSGIVTVNNVATSFPSKKVYNGVEVASGTQVIYHNNDGTANFKASCSTTIYSTASSSSGNGSWNLNTIPRAAVLTSAQNVTLPFAAGETVSSTVKWTSYNSSFYYKLGVSVPDSVGEYRLSMRNLNTDEIKAASALLNFSNVWIGNITKATKATATVTLETYSDSFYNNKIGSSSKYITLTLPTENLFPDVSFEIQNGTSMFEGKHCKGDTISVSTTAVPAKILDKNGNILANAEITAYSLTLKNGDTVLAKSTSQSTNIKLTESGELTVTVTATDSRGLSVSKDSSIQVYEYFTPQISSTYLPDNLQLHIAGSVAYVAGNNNVKSCSITIAGDGTTNTQSVALTLKDPTDKNALNAKYTFDQTVSIEKDYVPNIATATYTLTANLTDTAGNTKTASVQTGVTAFSLLAGGKGAAFFKEATTEGLLDVNGNLKVAGDIINKTSLDLKYYTAVGGMYSATGVRFSINTGIQTVPKSAKLVLSSIRIRSGGLQSQTYTDKGTLEANGISNGSVSFTLADIAPLIGTFTAYSAAAVLLSGTLLLDYTGDGTDTGDDTGGFDDGGSDPPITDGLITVKTTAEWDADPTKVSVSGNVYVYSDYKTDEDGTQHAGFKIGDGSAYVVDLPFASAYYEGEVVTATEKEFWNNKERTEVVGEELIFTKS